jgi:rod shape-determining protein MreD
MLHVLPAATIVIAGLIAVLPIGVGEMARYALSFLPLMAIHYWSARRPHLVPVAFIFAIGLAIDVLTHGPVGYWALLAVAVAALAQGESWLTGRSTALGRAATFVVSMAVAALVAWGVASIYTGLAIPARPLTGAALTAIMLYVPMVIAFMPIDRLWETPRARIFERGS